MSNISKYNDSKPIEIRSIEQEMLTKYVDEIMQKNKDDCYANIATPILDRYKDIKDIME